MILEQERRRNYYLRNYHGVMNIQQSYVILQMFYIAIMYPKNIFQQEASAWTLLGWKMSVRNIMKRSNDVSIIGVNMG